MTKEAGNINPKALLDSLGLPKEYFQNLSQSLSQAETLEDLRTGTLDVDQFLLPAFRPLYEQIPQVKEKVLLELAQTGVPPEMIDKYLIQSGNQPVFVFVYKHKAGEILDQEILRNFFEASRRCMFSTLKSVLRA